MVFPVPGVPVINTLGRRRCGGFGGGSIALVDIWWLVNSMGLQWRGVCMFDRSTVCCWGEKTQRMVWRRNPPDQFVGLVFDTVVRLFTISSGYSWIF